MQVDDVDVVVVGAGPAGLRTAQVLAESGREVIVVERRQEIGPKTCAGGLTPKAVRELEALGLPRGVGAETNTAVRFDNGPARPVDASDARVRTIARCVLGRLQAEWTRRAGATILAGTAASDIDLDKRQLRIGDRLVRYRHLVGADGSGSRVRRALGLPVPRALFAAEFNVPGFKAPTLVLQSDSRRLASGYFWIFPHTDYTSIGAIAPVDAVPPPALRAHLEQYASAFVKNLPVFEAATLEVQFVGFHFRDHVHLVGDAAGVASSLTGEGIYAALVTGEEVARQIIDPRLGAPKTRAWLRTKRVHDAVARLWRSRRARELSFRALERALEFPRTQRAIVSFFVS